MHRFIMHRPVKGLMGIYKRHTLAHHQFFTDHEPRIDTPRDFRITFFPPYALTTFICMSAAAALVLAVLWSANSGWPLVGKTAGALPNYQRFPSGCHDREDPSCPHIPYLISIR